MSKAQSSTTRDGFDLETLKFSLFVFISNPDNRPDEILHFGRELGLTSEEIQEAWNLHVAGIGNWPIDAPLPIEVVSSEERRIG